MITYITHFDMYLGVGQRIESRGVEWTGSCRYGWLLMVRLILRTESGGGATERGLR